MCTALRASGAEPCAPRLVRADNLRVFVMTSPDGEVIGF